jgi:hypothetical protein
VFHHNWIFLLVIVETVVDCALFAKAKTRVPSAPSAHANIKAAKEPIIIFIYKLRFDVGLRRTCLINKREKFLCSNMKVTHSTD